MFTGIISAVGQVARVERRAGRDTLFEIHGPYDAAGIAIGASIAHHGVCLTVIDRAPRDDGAWWSVQVSGETLSKTTLGAWEAGTPVNLERSLCLGDELGGHMVSGHVDAVGEIVSVRPEAESWRVQVRAPASLAGLIAAKGSVAVDGVSLTVNSVEDEADGSAVFGLNIIPHTWTATAFQTLAPGRMVNLEADMLARYVARIASVARRDPD
jgi:riboflavin synthase